MRKVVKVVMVGNQALDLSGSYGKEDYDDDEYDYDGHSVDGSDDDD